LPSVSGDGNDHPTVDSLPAELKPIKFEHCGRAFERYLQILSGQVQLDIEQEHGEDEVEDGDEANKYGHHKKKPTALEALMENYYDLLDLGDKKWRANQEDIKKAYRAAALKYHPDKLVATGVSQETAEEMFKKSAISL